MRYTVEFFDRRNGATSTIDKIDKGIGYTAEEYIEDCKWNCDEDWNEMLTNGDVTIVPIDGEFEIEILMLDHATRREAEKLLKNGTIVYKDFEEHSEYYIHELMECGCDDAVESIKEMLETGKPADDWGIVEVDGKKYYIEYVL